MRVVNTHEDATFLAGLLNGHERKRPVVVVSTPSGRHEPWIDVKRIEAELGDLAEVHLIPTGPHSWTFSTKMPAGTQVYGGAGRVYPVGHDWVGNLKASPLRLAYDASEGKRTTEQLIDDALGMAAAAGLFDAEQKVARFHRTGIVKGVVADRALIDHEGQLGYVAPALAFGGLPMDRILAKGMQVSGWWDPKAHWFDIRESRLDPVDALTEYSVDDVVLAVVHEVRADGAAVFLHPLVEVTVDRADITSDELVDVRDLMSPSEVLPVRVKSAGPSWRLSLLDIDDDEEPRRSIALFEGGPPWLLPPVVEEAPDSPSEASESVLSPGPAGTIFAVEELLAAMEASLAAVGSAIKSPAPATKPTPLMFDRERRDRARAALAPTPTQSTGQMAVETMGLAITKLKGQLARLREEIDPMHHRLSGLEQENLGLTVEVAQLRRQGDHQETKLRQARARLRRAGQKKSSHDELPVFADPEQGFRYAVLTSWAKRTPQSEQSARPLRDYKIGPRFLESLRLLEGVSTEKVADVVFEILTDRAKDLGGRDLHPLRCAEGGGSPPRTREDGATAWRAALQRNTASARRIHFWRLPDGSVELSRVVLHDDMAP